MERYGDPDFLYHKACAEVWGLLVMDLATSPLLPIDLVSHASKLGEYVASSRTELANATGFTLADRAIAEAGEPSQCTTIARYPGRPSIVRARPLQHPSRMASRKCIRLLWCDALDFETLALV
jgi:hypothetical protein